LTKIQEYKVLKTYIKNTNKLILKG